MIEVINLDYVRTTRAKGLSEWLVICRHALRNAALPLVTVAGLQFHLLLGGAVITETVFAVPGVGRLIVDGIRQLDFRVVQAAVFVLTMIVVGVNFAVDMPPNTFSRRSSCSRRSRSPRPSSKRPRCRSSAWAADARIRRGSR
jgi:peptide/nickel transport system permease protein